MNIIGSHDKSGVTVNYDVLNNAIDTYIKKTNYPKKIEEKRILATSAYYMEKVKQHAKVLDEANEEIIKTNDRLTELKTKTFELLHKLRSDIE